jgi:hypothetical protein
MGTASATPQRLYDYAAQSTHASGDLASYVRTTLARLIAAYDAGAISAGSGISGLTSGGTIGAEIDHLLTQIWATDSHVRTVGRRFEEAGSRGAPSTPPWLTFQLVIPKPDPTKPVETTDAGLDAASLADGAALARGLTMARSFGGKQLALHWQELAKHLDDPVFCAGYYNALTREQLEQLPWNATNARALAAAFASGQLTPQKQTDIAFVIMDRNNNTGEIPTAVFQALAANPAGAANFARYLLQDRTALKYFLRAKGWGDWYPGWHLPHGQAKFLQGLLPVLTSATSSMSREEVKTLLVAVGGHLPKLDVADARRIEPQLRQFLTTAGGRVLPPIALKPGQTYQQNLQEWAAAYGTTMQALMEPYQNWLSTIYTDHKEQLAAEHAFFENFVLGALGTAVGVATGGASLPVQAAANGAYGGLAGGLQPIIDGWLHWSTGADGPAVEPKNYLHASAILAIVVSASQRGGLVDKDPRTGKPEPVTLAMLQHDPRYAPALQRLLAAAERGEHPSATDMNWAYGLQLKDGGNLGAVIDALRSHFQ